MAVLSLLKSSTTEACLKRQVRIYIYIYISINSKQLEFNRSLVETLFNTNVYCILSDYHTDTDP